MALKEKAIEAIDYVKMLGNEAGVKVEPLFLKGIPVEKILDHTEENSIGLIVMGTMAFWHRRFLIGSAAENVPRHTQRIP